MSDQRPFQPIPGSVACQVSTRDGGTGVLMVFDPETCGDDLTAWLKSALRFATALTMAHAGLASVTTTTGEDGETVDVFIEREVMEIEVCRILGAAVRENTPETP